MKARNNMRSATGSRIKLGLVCTPGGHFEQMLNLAGLYARYPRFWITAKSHQAQYAAEPDKKYLINLAHFKTPWQYLGQLPKVIWAFAKERPTHLISTGSGRIVFVPFLVARLTGTKFIHIETFSHVRCLTKMGRILVALGQPVYSQWGKPHEKAIFLGPIIGDVGPAGGTGKIRDHVFVTTGTRHEPFPRLLQAVEDLVRQGVIRERVIVQAGHTPYRSGSMELFGFRPPTEIEALIEDAKFVITQESAGIATTCLKSSTPFIVMPRSYAHKELPALSDMNEDLHIKLAEMGYTIVVHDAGEMRAAIERIDCLRTRFPFENARALETLRTLIEGGN